MDYLKQAVKLANKNVESGGEPFAAMFVIRGQVFTGVNETHLKHDVSSHAELNALRKAQEALKTKDLSGGVMYASAYPCMMCLGALLFANVSEVYYFNDLTDASEVGLSLSKEIYQGLREGNLQLKLEQVELETVDPMKLWKARG